MAQVATHVVAAGSDRASPASSAQRLRAERVIWGLIAYAATGLIAWGCHLAGLLEAKRLVHYVLAALALNGVFLGLIATGLNLKLRDPSMAGAQIIASLWPAIYVMYHVAEPQARMPFLLQAMVAMLFGVLSNDFRRMLRIGAIVVFAYLVMLAALVYGAPERVHLAIEGVVLFSYAVVLVQVSFLGSYIAGLRKSLKARNQELRTAMAKLQDLATRDPLTQLPNRRAVMQQLEQEESRILRRAPDQSTPCIGLLDIDHFKKINDTYGHQVGDAVLRAVGGVIGQTLRRGDFAGRFGGEEFLLLFPESSLDGALCAAERLRAAIATIEITELPAAERIEVSIGLAAHQPYETLEHTLGRADRALYTAKQWGRARTVIDESRHLLTGTDGELVTSGGGGRLFS